MISVLLEIIQSIRWLHVFICTLTLTTLHLGFHFHTIQGHLPSSLATTRRGEEYLAFVLAVRDEGYYLKEWLQHHYYHMNVSHFYIIDDGSNPPLHTINDLGIPQSAVTFHYHDSEPSKPSVIYQIEVYMWCIQQYGHKHTWMGFIDLDEFLDIKTTETLEDILRDAETYDDIGALILNWKTHTSAGLLERPESVRQSFDICIDPNGDVEDLDEMVKTLVRTDRFSKLSTPHQAHLHPGNFSVGEDLKEATDPWYYRIPATHNRLFIHHYILKSKAEFQAKIDRWPENKDGRTWKLWDRIEDELAHVECSEMKRYNP